MHIMEESFRSRVDKIFGSLSTNSSSPAVSANNLWSITDDKVAQIKWNRDKGIDDSTDAFNPECDFLSVDDVVDTRERFPQIRLKELEDDIDELDERGSIVDDYSDFDNTSIPYSRRCDSLFDRDEWEIRSSIGLDCTLDNEEEEDEYDKVAVGTDIARDRLHLKEEIDDDSTAPSSSSSFKSLPPPSEANLKPILKRKQYQKTDTRSPKRVRFDPNCSGGDGTRILSNSAPDHIRNPSNYTHYTLDENDGGEDQICDKSNQKAYSEFLKTVKTSQNVVRNCNDSTTVDLPTSLCFIPRKKAIGMSNSSSVSATAAAVAMAAMDEEENQVCAMDEDGAQNTNGNGGIVPGRQYRNRTRYD